MPPSPVRRRPAGLLRSVLPAVATGNGPVFNNPLGTAAQQKAIFTQLVRLIDATPAGEQIRGSMHELADQEVANALIAAHGRRRRQAHPRRLDLCRP